MRIERNEYYMQIALLTAERGTCNRAKVGAIAVKDHRVIMSGYNGSPPGLYHCDDVGHLMINGHCERTVHAEQNVITQCAKEGIALKGATIYVTHEPCFMCLKLLISAGVIAVYFLDPRYDVRTPKEYYNAIKVIQLEV